MSSYLDKQQRLESFHRIKTKEKATQPFLLNVFQQQLLNYLQNLKFPKRVLILKPRQIGITTFICNYNLDEVFWKNNQFCAVIANHSTTAKLIFQDIIKFAFDRFPPKISIKPQLDSVNELFWKPFSSRIRVLTDLHGSTPNLLHITEMARIPKAYDILSEGYQAVPKSGTIIAESTANGYGNYFYGLWKETEEASGKNGWSQIFFNWKYFPEYQLPSVTINERTLSEEEKFLIKKHELTLSQIAWRRWKIEESKKKLDDISISKLSADEVFKQNYPLSPEEAFLQSSFGYFNSEILMKSLKFVIDPIKQQNLDNGNLKLYEDLKTNTPYFIAADTSEGSHDFSVAHILTKELGQIKYIGKLRGKWTVSQFASHLEKLGVKCNYALIIVERNNTGLAVISELKAKKYFNLYVDNLTGKIGFLTTKSSKPLICSLLADAIEEKMIFIPDRDTLKELLEFTNELKAPPGGFDDCVISLAIGHYIGLRKDLDYPELHTKPWGM